MTSAVESFDPMAAIAPRPAPRASQRDDDNAPSFADHVRNEVSRSDAVDDRRDAKAAADTDKAETSARAEAPQDASGDTPEDDQIAAQDAADTPASPPEKGEHAARQDCAYLIQSLADDEASQNSSASAAKAEKPDTAAQKPEPIIVVQDSAMKAEALKEALKPDAACDTPAPPPINKAQAAALSALDDQDETENAETPSAPQPVLAALTPPPAPQPQPVAVSKPKDEAAGAIDADAPRAPASMPREPQNANAPQSERAEAAAPDAAQSAQGDNFKPERAEARAEAPASATQTQPQASSSPQSNAAPNIHPALAPPSAITDPLQATANTAQSLAAEAARTLPAHAQVGREIVRRFDGENAKFEIRLDPPELGRVEIKLEVSRDHRVNAIVTADNPQALADLARSARDLTSALQSAGLELNENGLSFDLSQNQSQNSDRQAEQRSTPRSAAAEIESIAQPAQRLRLESWQGGRIDLVA